MSDADTAYTIEVSVASQQLLLFRHDRLVRQYTISTAKKGTGEQNGSEQTPRGKHYVRAKIGAGKPANTVFVGRRDTGERFTESLRQQFPERDWILTRIMWLHGCEDGVNRGGNVDTMRRYIYIHGAPDSDVMGIPSSHGCIKMNNNDMIELFDLVPAGTPVLIKEG